MPGRLRAVRRTPAGVLVGGHADLVFRSPFALVPTEPGTRIGACANGTGRTVAPCRAAALLVAVLPTLARLVPDRRGGRARGSGHDPTREGSGNPGASNVYRTAGPRPGRWCWLGDLAKGALAAAVGRRVGGRGLGLLVRRGGRRSATSLPCPPVPGRQGRGHRRRPLACSIPLLTLVLAGRRGRWSPG